MFSFCCMYIFPIIVCLFFLLLYVYFFLLLYSYFFLIIECLYVYFSFRCVFFKFKLVLKTIFPLLGANVGTYIIYPFHFFSFPNNNYPFLFNFLLCIFSASELFIVIFPAVSVFPGEQVPLFSSPRQIKPPCAAPPPPRLGNG